MSAALVPVLTRYSVDGGDDERSRRQGRENAAGLAAQEWGEFLLQFMPATDAALVRYQQLRDIADDGDLVLDELIAHEQALQAFAQAEIDGDHTRSLDPVRAVIERLAG